MKNQIQSRVTQLICATAIIGGSSLYLAPAQGLQITINATDRGWYDASGLHSPSNPNYLVGTFGPEFRNFFVFDLSSVTGTNIITSASLNLFNPIGGYSGPTTGLTYNVTDVSTPIDNLIDGTGGVAAFNDLGTGTAFGSAIATPASNNTFINIALNSSAISALSASSGLFAFGGSIPNPQNGQYIFAFSFGGNLDTQLVLETQPVPAPPALVGTVLAGAIAAWKKRPQRQPNKA